MKTDNLHLLARPIALLFLAFCHCTLYAQKEGVLQNGEAKLYYRTYGKGKPLLIINGGPGMNSDGFVNLARQLSKNNQTIIYDQRGTGRSTVQHPDSSNISMQLMAEDMEVLRKELKITTWSILGHSFGGMLASYYATLYPDRIDALILSSSGGIDLDLLNYVRGSIDSKLSPMELDSVNYWTNRISMGDTSYKAKLKRGTFLAAAYVYDRKNIPVIAVRLTQSNMRVNELVWQSLHKIQFDCAGKLSTFNKPVLIIQGKQDIVAEKTALKAKSVLKNSELVLLDHCIHYGWLDTPSEYFGSIEKFMAAN